MQVTVLGSGNGGLALAFDWARHGHQVRLCGSGEFSDTVDDVAAAGGITAAGQMEGFAPVAYSGTDIPEAVAQADLVFVAGPAFATAPLAEAARGSIRPGQAVIVCPTSCVGSAVAKRAIGVSADDPDYLFGETSTLPYAVRKTGGASIMVFHRMTEGFLVAGLPRSGTEALRRILAEVYPGVQSAQSIFQTTLQNGNPVIHPAVTLLNAALIERTGGDFEFYWEGVTPAVGRVMQGVDTERLAIAAALGVPLASEPELGMEQGYMLENNYTTGYSTAPGFKGIKAQDQLDNRYLTEDVGYSMLFWTDLARQLGVPTPVMDAVTTLASVSLGRDFRAEAGRTLANTGLADLTVEELRAL